MQIRLNKSIAFLSGVIMFVLLRSLVAQVGGTLDNSHNVVAGGGGSKSSGGSLTVDGTVGQPQAGTVSTGGNFSLRGGFWAHQALVPTAAPVSITGRVRFNSIVQRCRLQITLVDVSNGSTRSTTPNQFGYYKFDDVVTGVYLLRAESA